MKFLIIVTSFLFSNSTFHANSIGPLAGHDWQLRYSHKNISEYQWMQYQNYRKIQYGDQYSYKPLSEGQFYFIDSELLKQIKSLILRLLATTVTQSFYGERMPNH